MNEKFKSPEEPTGLTPEQEEEAQSWEAYYAAQEIPVEERIDCGPEIEKFEQLLTQFEEEHSLEELYAITQRPQENSVEGVLRDTAKKDLVPIADQLKFLKEGTNIPLVQYDELRERYMKLSRAVGMVTSDDSIDHTR